MPGRHERALQKTRFVVTITVLALAVLVYALKLLFGA